MPGKVVEAPGSDTVDLYYSAAWQVIEERESGLAVVSYVWSPVYVDAMISRDRDTDANGSLDERLYVLHDANFNVTGLVNTSGTVVERFTYEPFGKVEVRDSSWAIKSGGSGYAWLYLHQGGRFDSVSGLYAFRMREYSPTLGRWMTNDPIEYTGDSNNLYAYLTNNINLTDPQGTISVRSHSARPGGCGSRAEVLWSFTLDGSSLYDGYIVQRNIVYFSESKCVVDCSLDRIPLTKLYECWEAWPVLKGQTDTLTLKTYDDETSVLMRDRTVGRFVVHGELRYFHKSQLIDLEKDKKWGSGKVPAAGILLSTWSRPVWWDTKHVRSEQFAFRTFFASWSCCSSSRNTNVKTSGSYGYPLTPVQ